MKGLALTVLPVGLLLAGGVSRAQNVAATNAGDPQLERAISRTLLTLPEHSIFDTIRFRMGSNNQVTLDGTVTTPAVRDAAERALHALAGVGTVVDHLKVEPITGSVRGDAL